MSSDNRILNLEVLMQQGCEIIETVDSDLTFGVKVGNEYHYDLFDVLKTEFKSFESVKTLGRCQRYKDSFNILRSVLEMLLYFWLMVEAKKYQDPRIYTAQSSDDKSSNEIRDIIVSRWKKKKNEGDSKYTHIEEIKKSKTHDDQFEVIYNFEGLHDDKDGYHIPYYYFFLKDLFDSSRILAELASVDSGVGNPEIVDKTTRIQKKYYRLNMKFDSLLENLIRNELITKSQSEYIRVHYNFLSQYTHPSKNRFESFIQGVHGHSYSEYSDEVYYELILLYVCRFQLNFFKIIVNKFKKENPNAKTKEFFELMEKLNSATEDLWFFDGKPSEFDKLLSRGIQFRKNRKVESEWPIFYYDDPLWRLSRMR